MCCKRFSPSILSYRIVLLGQEKQMVNQWAISFFVTAALPDLRANMVKKWRIYVGWRLFCLAKCADPLEYPFSRSKKSVILGFSSFV